VVEVFPHPATVSLFDAERTLKYKARQGRRYSQRWRDLEQLRDRLISLAGAGPKSHLSSEVATMSIEGQRGRAFKEAEDMLEAIVCACSALYAWHHGPPGYAVYGSSLKGDASDGHILVPMTASLWERIKTPRLLLLNRDGTLNQRLGCRPPLRPDEVRLLPGIGLKLRQYAALGWRLGCDHQPGQRCLWLSDRGPG
jgi:hypothetical protein